MWTNDVSKTLWINIGLLYSEQKCCWNSGSVHARQNSIAHIKQFQHIYMANQVEMFIF